MAKLITRQQAKDFLQITTSDSDDLIDLYIELVTSEIETYVDRNLLQGTYEEPIQFKDSRLDFTHGVPLDTGIEYPTARLRNYPVQEVTGIAKNGVTITDTNYYVYEDNGVIEFFKRYSDDQQKLKIAYTAGYTTVTGTAYTVPKDLQMVTYLGVKVMFENGGVAKEGKGNVTSKSLKDFRVSYGNEQSGLYAKTNRGLAKSYIAGNQDILDSYRHIEL